MSPGIESKNFKTTLQFAIARTPKFIQVIQWTHPTDETEEHFKRSQTHMWKATSQGLEKHMSQGEWRAMA